MDVGTTRPSRRQVGDAVELTLMDAQHPRKLLVRRCRLVVGRSPECAIHLECESVSRWHAALDLSAEPWTIQDLDSRNGTRVASGPVGEQPTPIAPGSNVEVGDVMIVVGRPPLAASAPASPTTTATPDKGASLTGELEALERQRILEALERCQGNQSAAARLLGMPRRTLVARLDRYGFPRPRKRSVP